MVRLAIQNLAGVPAIVFGLFGLGFFIEFVGRGIDKAFYGGDLTYGQPAIVWAALTLALLTMPTVERRPSRHHTRPASRVEERRRQQISVASTGAAPRAFSLLSMAALPGLFLWLVSDFGTALAGRYLGGRLATV